MKDTTIAVGLAKNVFEIAISREAGKVSKQLRVSRPKLVSFFAKQSAATVLLEACGSAHFWARTLRRLGHDVVLLPPHLVRPYRRGSKNDRADAQGGRYTTESHLDLRSLAKPLISFFGDHR